MTNKISMLHNKAMEYAENAQVAKIRQKSKNIQYKLLRSAYALEKEAAELACRRKNYEPTRSVLLRSAASLALSCNLTNEAEKLIATALAGNPDEDIANELRDLLEQVYFERHLDLKGQVLTDCEIMLTISGPGVNYGMVGGDEFIKRFQGIEKLLHRTAERKTGNEYREAGATPSSIRKELELYMGMPIAASYSMRIRVGKMQMSIPGAAQIDIPDVIRDVISNISVINKDGPDGIEGNISDEAYRRNFTALTKSIAPDGKKVTLVGVQTTGKGNTNKVMLTRQSENIPLFSVKELKNDIGEDPIVKVGRLLGADAKKDKDGTIKIVEANGEETFVFVPKGIISDIVRPHWDRDVTLLCAYDSKRQLHYRDIKPL